MKYEINLTPRAARHFRGLAHDMRQVISVVLNSLENNPRPVGVKRLKHEQELYRIRVRHYRIIYAIDDKACVVSVSIIRHRKEAFRNI